MPENNVPEATDNTVEPWRLRVQETARRRAVLNVLRAEFAERRRHGLKARHEAKLRRSANLASRDEP